MPIPIISRQPSFRSEGENSMNSNDLVIGTKGLGKSFGEVRALKSLDLRVPQKSIFAFLGPNGAGKTTTIKLLLIAFGLFAVLLLAGCSSKEAPILVVPEGAQAGDL